MHENRPATPAGDDWRQVLAQATWLDDDSGYGSRWLPVLRALWADHRDGEGARMRARLGFSTPPDARTRIWVRAGTSPFALRLACEVLAVLRERRKDMQLVLTFEHDDQPLMQRYLAPDRKLVLGWGPADWTPATCRFLRRFCPAGVVLVGTAAHSRSLASSSIPLAVLDDAAALKTFRSWRERTQGRSRKSVRHCCLRLGGDRRGQSRSGVTERVTDETRQAADRPLDRDPASLAGVGGDACRNDSYWVLDGGSVGDVSALHGDTPTGSPFLGFADPRARFVEAQADMTMAALLGDANRPTWLVLVPECAAATVSRRFKSHALANVSTLMLAVLPTSWVDRVSDSQAAVRVLQAGRTDGLTPLASPPVAVDELDVCVSAWARTPLDAGSILWLDRADWLASAATAAHAVAWIEPGYSGGMNEDGEPEALDRECALMGETALHGALWPIMAAGRPCWRVGAHLSHGGASSVDAVGGPTSPSALRASPLVIDSAEIGQVFDEWLSALNDGRVSGFAWRRSGDMIRQGFWSARRSVDADFSALQDWVWAR